MAKYRNDLESRQQVVAAQQHLVSAGLTSGATGNVSVRTDDGMLITPTGIQPKDLAPEYIVHMKPDGAVDEGEMTPSSEWRMHADIYAAKPALHAVVHCHSNYATILACAQRSIPSHHYMIAATGGYEIPLATYAIFGSQSLSDAALKALSTSMACLLANHGQLTTGSDLPGALKLADLVEELAHWYWGTLVIGGPKLLGKEQMDEVLATFATYGQQEKRKDLAAGNSLDGED
jgi:L-fuculose-phosphate aldolase